MKFSGKMRFKIILKVTKKHGFTLSIEDTFFKKPQGVGVNLNPLPPKQIRVKLIIGRNWRFFDVTSFIDKKLRVLTVANKQPGWLDTEHILS